MTMRHPRLQGRLERRAAELSDEIRHYPSPIARCDEQLTDLLERRARVFEILRRLGERPAQRAACAPLAVWTNDGGRDAA